MNDIPTLDELRLRQALLIYGATPAAYNMIMSIAQDIRRTAYNEGWEARTQALALHWSFAEEGRWQ